MRYFYAEYCPYGCNISYDSLNGKAFTFYAFRSKRERSAWLDKHEYDYGRNLVAQETTRKTVEQLLGKHFIIDKNEGGVLECYQEIHGVR